MIQGSYQNVNGTSANGKPADKPIMFITLFDHDAAKLRSIGLDARQRPEAGIFDRHTLREFRKRDVAIVNLEAFRDDDWAQRALADVAKAAKRCGILVPEACQDRSDPKTNLDDVFASYDDYGYHDHHAETFCKEAELYLEPAAKHRPTETDKPRKRANLVVASSIKPMPIEWLWNDRIPLGTLTSFAGDMKLGKSSVAIDLAAAVSRGRPLPQERERREPGSVVIMSAEDDPARVIIPRLISSDADLTKIHILDSVIMPDGAEAFPSLRADIDTIASKIDELNDCRLVIIDPITAYLEGIDDHKNAQLRGVLGPLSQQAERLDISIVLITHISKGNGTHAKHRVAGSIAYVAACRANFLFVEDKTDPTRTRCLMIPNGCNLSPVIKALAYSVRNRGDGTAVEWDDEPVDITADQAIAVDAADDDRSIHSEVDDWLRGQLAGGSRPVTEILSEGKTMHYSDKQIRASKDRLSVIHTRCGFGKDSITSWSLPDPPETY